MNETVHIETASSLETDSFLNAFRRFVARRGPVREIRSDQGTNLVGAEKELQRALEEMDNGSIQRSVCREFKADWVQCKRNPPSASLMAPNPFCSLNSRCVNATVVTTNPFEP